MIAHVMKIAKINPVKGLGVNGSNLQYCQNIIQY